MAITVKELIKDQLDWADESGKYGDLAMPVILQSYKEIFENILETYKNELAEKDNEIKDLKRQLENSRYANFYTQYFKEFRTYSNQHPLFKEEFEVFKSCYGCFNNNFDSEDKCYICHANKVIKLKDNSKYDKLPSKDVK